MVTWRGPLAAGLALALAAGAVAAPRVPASDDEVVERLPSRSAAWRQERAALRKAPQAWPLATGTARSAIARARATGDPRELGLAQAALAPWWTEPAPPPPVRLLRATIRQSQHAFGEALTDLEAVRADPAAPAELRAQAALTGAAVLQVLGRLDEAERACGALQVDAGTPPPARQAAGVCLAELRTLRGDPASGEAALARLAAADARAGGALVGWIALVRAEAAERRGDGAAAERHYRTALGAADDVYTRAAFADFLLDQGRPAEVLPLVEGRDDADALLLRHAIARQRLHDPAAPALRDRLLARFEAARERGDAGLHRREEARLALDLQREPARALTLALAQWRDQKEPADAWLLARAAQAAGRHDALEPLRAWQREQGYADRRLDSTTLATSSRSAR